MTDPLEVLQLAYDDTQTPPPAADPPADPKPPPVAAGWVLVAPSAVTDAAVWVRSAHRPVTTVTADVREALRLVGAGEAAGVLVAAHAQLVGVVEVIGHDPTADAQRPVRLERRTSRRAQIISWPESPLDPRSR